MKTRAAGGAGASRYRFVILATVWASYLIVYLSRLSVGPLSPFLRDSFDLSGAQIGALMSATALTYAPAMVVAGTVVDRVGVKRVLVFGAVVTGVCVGLLFVTPSFTFLVLLLALSGLGCGCIYPCAVKALVAWFSAKERGTAIGVNQTAINVSGILGAAVLPGVAVSLGWRYGFLLVGVLAVCIAVVCLLLYRDPRPLGAKPAIRVRTEDTATADAGGAGDAAQVQRGPRRVTDLLRMGDIWLLAFGGLLMGVVEFSALAHMVLFFEDALGLVAVAAGGMLALCEIGGGVGKPLVGLVSDRFLGGRRRPVLLLLAVLAGLMCVFLALTSEGSGWVVWSCLVIFGIAAVGWAGLYATLAGELAGVATAGLAAGLCSALTNVGIIVGPPLFGYLVDMTGSYRPSWLFMAVAAGLASVSWALIRERSADQAFESRRAGTPDTPAMSQAQ